MADAPNTAAARRAAAEAKLAAAKAAEQAAKEAEARAAAEMEEIKDDAPTIDPNAGLEQKLETVETPADVAKVTTTFDAPQGPVGAVGNDGPEGIPAAVPGSQVPGAANKPAVAGAAFPNLATQPRNQPPGSPLVRGGAKLGPQPTVEQVLAASPANASGSGAERLFTVSRDPAGNLSVDVHAQDVAFHLPKVIAWLITESGRVNGGAQLTLEAVTSHLKRTPSGKIDLNYKPTL